MKSLLSLLLSSIVMLTACAPAKELPNEILFKDQPFCYGLGNTGQAVEVCGLDVYEFPNGILIHNKNKFSSIAAEITEERPSNYACRVIYNATVIVGEKVCGFRVINGQMKDL